MAAGIYDEVLWAEVGARLVPLKNTSVTVKNPDGSNATLYTDTTGTTTATQPIASDAKGNLRFFANITAAGVDIVYTPPGQAEQVYRVRPVPVVDAVPKAQTQPGSTKPVRVWTVQPTADPRFPGGVAPWTMDYNNSLFDLDGDGVFQHCQHMFWGSGGDAQGNILVSGQSRFGIMMEINYDDNSGALKDEYHLDWNNGKLGAEMRGYRPFMTQYNQTTGVGALELAHHTTNIVIPNAADSTLNRIMATFTASAFTLRPVPAAPTTISLQAAAGQKSRIQLGYDLVDATTELTIGANANYFAITVSGRTFTFANLVAGIAGHAGIGLGTVAPAGHFHSKGTSASIPGLMLDGSSGQLAALALFRDNAGTTTYMQVNKHGYLGIRKVAAIADADIVTSEMFPWWKNTAGAAGLQIKGKDSGGVVVAQDFSKGAAVAAPAGGTTVDTEARAAINAIIGHLQRMGVA